MEQSLVQCNQAFLASTVFDTFKHGFVLFFSELWWVGDIRKAHDNDDNNRSCLVGQWIDRKESRGCVLSR